MKLLGETRAEKRRKEKEREGTESGNMEEDSQQDVELERAANLMTFFVAIIITTIAVISVYLDGNQYI